MLGFRDFVRLVRVCLRRMGVQAGVMCPKRGGSGTPRAVWSSRWRWVSSVVWVNCPSWPVKCPWRMLPSSERIAAPGFTRARLGETDDDEREEADQDVRADALVLGVKDGP